MIKLEQVTKQYDLPSEKGGELVAADRLDLDIADGELFGLIGPNGAGKNDHAEMVLRPSSSHLRTHHGEGN